MRRADTVLAIHQDRGPDGMGAVDFQFESEQRAQDIFVMLLGKASPKTRERTVPDPTDENPDQTKVESYQSPATLGEYLRDRITAFIVYALMFDTIAADGTRVTHWRHIFYIFGAIGVFWCVAWWWWYRDNPADGELPSS